ncbi:MAG: hypothetical protein AAF579_02990 [Cyanobacteria bacterium P01_C01_bin.118]
MSKAALLIGLVVVSAVAGGSFAYGWHSVTSEMNTQQSRPAAPSSLPVEATVTSEPTKDRQPDHTTPVAVPTQTIEEQLANAYGQISVTLNELQLNQLVHDAILSQPQAAQLFVNAKSLETKLANNLLETGAVLNLSELPRDNLSEEIQTVLDQLASAAPMLAARDIYIGIVARPQVLDGQVTLVQDLSLKLGQFTLPMDDVAVQMGISIETVEHRLNAIINQQGLLLETIEVLDNQLVITGTRS